MPLIVPPKIGTQVWWRHWQGTVAGYEPGKFSAVHVDLHTHQHWDDHAKKFNKEPDRYFELRELSLTPPGDIKPVPAPPIKPHHLRTHVVDAP
jgi:hypothetical protein